MVKGNLEVIAGACVAADVYASGRIKIRSGSSIVGASVPYSSYIPSFPVLPTDQSGWNAQLLSGGQINLSTLRGVYFAQQEEIEISGGTYTGPLTIIATKKIRVKGDLRATNPEQGLLTLIAPGKKEPEGCKYKWKEGKVTFEGRDGVKNVDALILAREFKPSEEETNTPVSLYGSIVVQKLGGKRPINLTYCGPELVAKSLPEALKSIEKSRSITLISWKEK